MSSARKNARTKALLNRFADNGFDSLQRLFLVQDIAKAERRGEILGRLWYLLDQKHRERCIANLGVAFPELTPARRKAMSKEVFLHFGRVAADFLRSPIRANSEVIGTEVVNPHVFDEAREYKRGVLAVTAHFGNWERFAHWGSVVFGPVSVVAREANQSGVQEKLDAMRERNGVRVLYRGDSARAVLRCLRNGEMVGLLPDQNDDECFVPFFGIKTGTVLGPGVLKVRTGASLIPAYCVRTGVGQYRILLRDPIDPDNLEKNPEVLMTRLNAVLEEVIQLYPEQYLWMHDRWKDARLKGYL